MVVDEAKKGPHSSDFSALPEGCIASVISFTSPHYACRLASVSSIFKSACDSDMVWASFLPPDYCLMVHRSAPSLKELYFSLSDDPVLVGDRKMSNPPLLLTKSTEPHPIQITSIKLNGDNFFRWSQSVRMYIRGRGKSGYLTGDNAEPATDDPTWAVWDAENSAIMTWLTNSMEEDIGANYLGYYTAKELWDAVCEMYSDLGNQSQIYELTLKLGKMRQGEETVTKYFHSLKRLWQELDVFNDHE